MANIMTKRGNLDNIVTYEYYCDTHSDMAAIDPRYITLGSIAIVLQDEGGSLGIYMANSNSEWISLGASISSGGNSGSEGSGPIADSTILRI